MLAERRQQRAGSMCGGEQQMLALGMALMTKPKWLLLDEPSTGLAPVIVRNVMRRLAEINERMGVGLILVEQNVPATLKMVEHAIILRSGRIAFQGSAQRAQRQYGSVEMVLSPKIATERGLAARARGRRDAHAGRLGGRR